MARLVVGLYAGIGVALDAYHRLHTEGFPETRLGYQILAEGGPAPPSVGVEPPLLEIEPKVLDDARRSLARLLQNGATAVFVQIEDDADADAATDILGLYAPLAVETLLSGADDQ
jgi:hypothetical protein